MLNRVSWQLATTGHCPFAQKTGATVEPGGIQQTRAGRQAELPADANYPSPALPFWRSRRREIHAKFLHKVKCFWRKAARVKLAVRMR